MLRLQSATDFERVRREGKSHAHPLAVLITARRAAAPDQPPLPTRCGFAAGRRVGNAVARNRAKRLLRAAVHARAEQLLPGWDLIFMARAPLAQVTLPEAQPAVDALLQRAQVVYAPK